MATVPSYKESGTVSRATRRREREREIIAATRLLFDERGLQDAPIESIAREVGINKALIYRHFSSKEELYVLTLSSYLADLAEPLGGGARRARPRRAVGGGLGEVHRLLSRPPRVP